jgi:hypothetical protein
VQRSYFFSSNSQPGILHLVQLRNPWGRGSWKGDFGVGSDRWKQDSSLKEELGYYSTSEEDDGGVFWMTLKDWFYHFSTLYICRSRGSSSSSSSNGSSSNGNSRWSEVRAKAPLRNVTLTHPSLRPTLPCFRVEVLANTEVEMTLHQASARGTPSGVVLCTFGMVLMRELADGDGKSKLNTGSKSAVSSSLEYVASSPVQCHPRVRCDAMLVPGMYIVVPVVFNASSSIHSTQPGSGSEASSKQNRRGEQNRNIMSESIVLSIHCPKPLLVTELRCYPKTVEMAIVGRVKAQGAPWGGGNGGTDILIYSLTDGGGAYVMCENNMRNQDACVTLDLSGSSGLVTSRGSEKTVDVVKAGRRMLINCATTLVAGGWSVRKSIQWQARGGSGSEQHEPGINEQGLHEPFVA